MTSTNVEFNGRCNFGRALIIAGIVWLLFGSVRAEPAPRDLAEHDGHVTDADRQHWSYQPVRRPLVPRVRHVSWTRTPIDSFVLAKLESKGWQPARPASPRALLRRLYLDLIGLPPTVEQQQRFLRTPSDEELDAEAERLLGDPAYGERWGRHWLDLVRYADTNGYERDATKPNVWRYRDYVIDAFNSDKPFDRFVIEQLAGDELDDANTETMIATGYSRLGPWDDEPADPLQDRADQLDDMIRTTSQAFLGLTLGCARCHDHKFDALTMLDYYRMSAIFEPLQRPRDGRIELDLPAGSSEQRAAVKARDDAIAELKRHAGEIRDKFRLDYLAGGRCQLPAEAVEAFRTAEEQRTPSQKELASHYDQALRDELSRAMPADRKREVDKLERQCEQLRRLTPDLPRGYFMQESSPFAGKSFLLMRGRAALPGPEVQPGLPTVLVSLQPRFLEPTGHTTRRRLTLARWIASRDNPLTARVIVNRVWQHHFGEGLVRTASDFGVLGDEPTHPELLDWLAHWFVHDAKWSLKKLHRLIVMSNTYRMSKRWNATLGAEDPENRQLWRFPYRRLEVEAIRDSMLAVSGQLNRQMHGPSVYLHVPPEALEGHSDPDKIWKPFDEREASRRTVYAFIKRSLVVPMLEVLDFCDTTNSSERRNVTSVAPQALTLFNGDFVNRQARHLADRLRREVGENQERQIERAYLLALCRPPTPDEQADMRNFLNAEAARMLAETDGSPQRLTAKQAGQKALVQVCRVIFNLDEFVYTN